MQGPILVAYAEDHNVIREGIVKLIESDPGMSVIVQGQNGAELIEKLRRSPTLPDVCLLDLEMPILNGFDTTIEILQLWPQMRVMAFSTFENEIYLIRMIQNGATGFLAKNCDRQTLLHAIRSMHRNGRYYSSRFSKSFIAAVENNQISVPSLTWREEQVLHLSCTDMSYTEMAKEMSVSTRSIEGFRDNLFKKLNLKSRAGLVKYAIKFGFLPPED